MDQLERVFNRFDEEHLDNEQLLREWSGIDVAATPADFQIAWPELRRAYSSWTRNIPTQRENESMSSWLERFNEATTEYRQKTDNLKIIAAQYLPETRQRLSDRAALQRLANEALNESSN